MLLTIKFLGTHVLGSGLQNGERINVSSSRLSDLKLLLSEKAFWFVESPSLQSVTFQENYSESPLVISYGKSSRSASAASSTISALAPLDEALYRMMVNPLSSLKFTIT